MNRYQLYNLLCPSDRPFTSDQDMIDNISEAQEREFVKACDYLVYSALDGALYMGRRDAPLVALNVLTNYARKGVGR